jgi:Na+-transporting NADH:ubiquinone oxidoreductase subunit NqrD
MAKEKMMDAFLDGIAKGIGYTLAGIAMALILVLLMFGSPESKTKSITEPPCMIRANI